MEQLQNIKLPKILDDILNQKCISHAQVIQAITNGFLKYKQIYGEPPDALLWFAKQVPKQLMDILRDEQIDAASGEELDTIAKHFNTQRLPNQTDVELRNAIKRGTCDKASV